MGKVKVKNLIIEFFEIKYSNDSSRSKPNRYRIIVEKAIKYIMDIDEDELHSLGVLVDRYRDYPMTYSSGQNRRVRTIVNFCNKWSHSTSESFQENELYEIESLLKEFLDKIFNLDIEVVYQNYKNLKPIRSNTSTLKQRPNTKKLLNVIQNTLEIIIDKSNFNKSTINSNGKYSVEPNQNCPNSDWVLCLINTRSMEVNIFTVPKNSRVYSQLYFRNDKNRYRLTFSTSDPDFIDEYSSERFNRFLTGSFKLENLEIFS